MNGKHVADYGSLHVPIAGTRHVRASNQRDQPVHALKAGQDNHVSDVASYLEKHALLNSRNYSTR